MQELQQLNNVKILDVRESDEHATGVIPGVMLAPMSNFMAYLPSLDKKETYYVVCQSGGRSLQVCGFLDSKGYDVVNVMGGMGAYNGKKEVK